MKSALGLLGVSVLLFSCSGDGGVSFADLPSAGGGQGATGNDNAGGTGNQAGSGSQGGTDQGGKSQGGTDQGGKSQGGASAGTSGKPNGGAGATSGSGGGPGMPEVIYVSIEGTDAAECGLSAQTACQSISHGSERAIEAERDSVFVQAGTYDEVVVLKPGVHVIGGFDAEWEAGDRTQEAHRVVIGGGLHTASQEYLAVWAHDLETQASLQNLVIEGPDAEGHREGSRDGRSSYGIHAVGAKLLLKDVDIIAGSGAEGEVGPSGQDAAETVATDAMHGHVGGNGSMIDTGGCSLDESAGGEPGTNSCGAGPSASAPNGGKGGNGGARDTACGSGMGFNYSAQAGTPGADADLVSGTFGKGGPAGSGGRNSNPAACSDATEGKDGAVANGLAGKAASGGTLQGDFWYALPGGDGGTGSNGGGGGGGGGAGSCDNNLSLINDARGPGGGGGGAGGCAARAGGGGGGGGGGSFGIFASGSTIEVSGVSIERGSGGDGGDGGVGGQGQSGGLGKSGGTANNNITGAPGKGGNGGHGGHGGGGAGGNGGHAVAVLLGADGVVMGEIAISGGAPGMGGAGGASAPNAPEAERDGNDGEAGSDGTLEESLQCDGSC